MEKKLIPIIICGGSGSRLWPISDHQKPKQFLNLFNNKSLFELTLERCKQLSEQSPIIITSLQNKKHILPLIKKYYKNIFLIYEEVGRNTATALTLSLSKAKEIDPKASTIILPSDHHIKDHLSFSNVVKKINPYLNKYIWHLIGIPPKHPATGYGYIKAQKTNFVSKIEYFIEKPNYLEAKKLLKNNKIFWNSGIFIGEIEKLLLSIQENCTDIYNASLRAWRNREIIDEYSSLIKENYLIKIRSESIDKAVIEKEKSRSVIILNAGWSDVGSWDSLADIKYFRNNFKSNIFEENTKNNFIYSPDNLTVAIGVDDIIIVNFEGVTLVIKKGESEKLKKVLKKISAKSNRS